MEKQISKLLISACLTMLVGLTGYSGSVYATTADGVTPANEGVCDVLHGGTPGLYGLCVAYCEAQDLDEIGDKETPNNKILANYRKKMQAGDPDMPCIKVPCPCWENGELEAIRMNSTDNSACTISDTVARIQNRTPSQFAYTTLPGATCRLTDTSTTPRTSLRFTISAEDAQSCYNQIVQACATLPAVQ